MDQRDGVHTKNNGLAIGAGKGHIEVQFLDPLAAKTTRLFQLAGVVPSISARRASQPRSNYVASHSLRYDRQVRKPHQLS